MTRKWYSGNYPSSADYNPNIPIGYNKWDAMECDEDNDEEDINDEPENDDE